MASFDRPVLQALVVADHVYRDGVTGKHIVTGIFHTMFVATFQPLEGATKPAGPEGAATPPILQPPPQPQIPFPQAGFFSGSPFAYLSMVNVRNIQEFRIRYVELDTEQVHFEFRLQVNSKDPIVPAELSLPLPILPQKIGGFALEVLWHDEPLGSYRINILNIPFPQQGQTNDSSNPPEKS